MVSNIVKIEPSEIILYGQNVYSRTGDIFFTELLARQVDENGQPSACATFLNETKFKRRLMELDYCVVERALNYLSCHDEAVLSCNITAQHLRHDAAWEKVCNLISRNTQLTKRLILEITETGMIANPQRASPMLKRAQHIGCRVAMDDFGIGYSTPYLAQLFDFDIIKVDRSFQENFKVGKQVHESRLRHLVGYALCCAPCVVVEGIEKPEQAELAIDAGAIYLQGYLYDKPHFLTSI